MKIIEVRDGFVKIESPKRAEVSSFLEIKGLEKRYIAQVIRSKNNGAGYSVYAKILFIYDGTLRKYDKTMPDNSAEISEFSYNTINNSFNYTNPIVAGKFISDGSDILLDSESFNNLTLASIDNNETSNVLVQNLAKQFKQLGKTIVIDMLGVVNCDKYIAGRDFKLPLNSESLQFMYEDCLSDATSDSKNMIKDIFTDLAEYSKEVKFLPFNTLKTIVDDMVEKQHIFKLLVLKNKLTKFENAGYFASYPADAENLSKIIQSDFAVIDLSKVNNMFQNRYLSLLLSELKNSNSKISVLIEASNAINKKNIKTLLVSENIKTTFITHSRFKYLSELKQLFKNYILDNSHTNKDIFSLYSFFIEAMSAENYLIVGDNTNYVPVISKVEKYDVELRKLPQDSVSEEVLETSYDSQIGEDTITMDIPETEIIEPVEESEEVILQTTDSEKLADEDTVADTLAIEETEEQDLEETEQENPIFELNEEEPDIDESQVSENESQETEETEIVEDSTTSEVSEDEVTEIDGTETENEFHTEVTTSNIEEYEDVTIPLTLAEDIEEIENEDFSPDTEMIDEVPSDFQEAEPDIIPLENQDVNIGEFEELEIDDNENNEDVVVDLTDDEAEVLRDLGDSDYTMSENTDNESEPLTQENVDKLIAEDVDKVFSTIKDDNISDSDLDLIDTLNEYDENEQNASEDAMFTSDDMEALQELASQDEEDEGFIEPLEEVSDSANEEDEKEILEKRESTTPIVPIYDAGIPEEDKVISDAIEQGDAVIHAKYGSGVVEKMIKYGNKNLYSINFDNVGRRLLDPTLTEIKKA